MWLFGISYRKIEKFSKLKLFNKVSKSSVHEWVKAVEGIIEISLETKHRNTVAIDETILKIQGVEVYLWLRIDVETREIIAFHVSPTREGLNATFFLKKIMSACINKPLLVVDGAGWYPWTCERFGLTCQRMTRWLRNSIEQCYKFVKDRTRAFYNNFGCNKFGKGLEHVRMFMKLFLVSYYQEEIIV